MVHSRSRKGDEIEPSSIAIAWAAQWMGGVAIAERVALEIGDRAAPDMSF